jgi:hypothetical protein
MERLRQLATALTHCRDIQVLKTYGAAPYGAMIKKLEKQIKEKQQSVDEKIGVKVRGHSGPLARRSDC